MERKVDPASLETAVVTSISGSPSSMAADTQTYLSDEGRFVPGTLLSGRYRIIGLLGVGGMGEVYRATDLTLGQSVALKFLPAEAASNQRLLERFHGEVRVARQVSHPNVCRVYDIGEAEGMPFISMEYVDGEDLASLLRRIGRLPSDKAIETARKICAGLAAAHDRGVIHRDLKPHNIMMNKRGEVVIMDFGLAAIADQLTGTEVRNGTPMYMSPEQLRGTGVTTRSDIYSLGLVVYELFTGKRPYEARNMAQLLELQEAAQLTSMSSIAVDIDPAVEIAVRQCLDPDPLRRPASALAVSAALPGGDALAAALAAGETPSPEMVAQSGRTEGLERRYSIPCVLLIAACMIAAALIRDHSYALLQTPVDMPPDVLAQKSRDVAEQFGYTRKPGDSDIRVDHRVGLIRYMNEKPGPRKWDEWLGSEAPVMSIYRESLGNLDAHPFGRVTPDNPAPIRPGMVFVNLEGRGNLRELFAVPYAGNAAPVSTEAIFRAIGFDPAKFTQAPVEFIPRYAADRSEFWKGPHPVLPDTEMRVELAWWQGRPTHVRVAYPFMGNEDAAQRQQRLWIWKVRGSLLLFASLVGTLFVVLLARRNWKLGRTDRRGALRLATFKFILGMLVWLGSVHPVQSDAMIFFLLNGAADWLMVSAMVWVIYLALEPAVRSHWPHALVTWNRVLTGRWADAQVGAHVLIGATVGACVWVVASVVQVTVEPDQLVPGGALFPSMGARQWVAEHAGTLLDALNVALVGFFFIFGLRRILRKDILAAFAAAVFFAFSQRQVLQSPDWVLHLVSFVAIAAILIFILLRLGLVATLAAMFYIDSFDALAVGVDWKTWFAPYGMATLALLIGIALFAFNRSLGSRELLGGSEQRA